MSEDPIGFSGGSNFYTYVHNRPTIAFDPFGTVEVVHHEHINELADIDAKCVSLDNPTGITAGGCNKVQYAADFTCYGDCPLNWTVGFTVTLYGDIFVATGRYPYKGRPPGDHSIRDTASSLAHEQLHTADKLNAILPIFRAVEARAFETEQACEAAAEQAALQASAAWERASQQSQRRRQ